MNKHHKRWAFVLNWAKNVQKYLNEGYFLYEDGNSYDASEFHIDEENQLIFLTKILSRYTIYDGNPNYDHGYYTPIPDLKRELLEFKLVKIMDIDLFKKVEE
jgi:hypothetical protein